MFFVYNLFGGNMKKFIVFLLAFSLFYVSVFCSTGLIEAIENNETESNSTGKKPACCIEFSFLSKDMNMLKDNFSFGCCTGSPLGGTIAISIVSLFFLLIVGLFEAVFSGGSSKTIWDFTQNMALPIMITFSIIGTIFVILANLLYPYYDYEKNIQQKTLSNKIILLERAGGCTFSLGISVLFIWLFFRSLNTQTD